MPRIRQLSQSLINKIAAGEVIERPASVVKELLENAVDGGARRIDVAVEKGGLELVRVADDGCGIAAEDLPLAVASHATSKLDTAEDLFCIRSFGFRGEALASIGEVSRLVIRSRTAESPAGAEITVNGGRLGETAPCGAPVGTTVEVRNLFFNTPVRRKFLRTVGTELGHLTEAFIRVALGVPGVHFTLRHNGRVVHELPAADGSRERFAALFGHEMAERMLYVESSDGEVRLAGYVGHPSQTRANNRAQYLFLNGRYIRDRSLQHALGEGYRGLIVSGRYPVAVLTLTMPPDLVDVNVHPTKLEVRFQDAGRLYSQLLATLRGKFLSSDLTHALPPAPAPEGASPAEPADPRQAESDRLRDQFVAWAKGEVEAREPEPAESIPRSPLADPGPPLSLTRLDAPRKEAVEDRAQGPEAGGRDPENGGRRSEGGEAGLPPPHVRPVAALQLHNRYLVAETAEGMVVVDQHALHERILYEQLRGRVAEGPLESQALLVPEPIDLSPTEAAAALEHRDLLERLGMKVEPFGGDTLLLAAYPAMLAKLRPEEVLRALLEVLLAGGRQPDRRDLTDALLHTMACKAAVKAGDRLAADEVAALLEQRHLVDDAHHCPHGRPTALVFTRAELDRRFLRT